jgi:hypothetical protein
MTIFIISGCAPQIGIQQYKPEDCESSNRRVLWKATKDNESNYNSLIEKGIWPTKHDFIKYRGEPDEIKTVSGNIETWSYNEKVWCGYGPHFLILVPIVLPVCNGYSRITFEDDAAVKINHKVFSINNDWSTEPEYTGNFCEQ